MKLRKRFLAALVAVAMLVTMVPFGAVFANETADTTAAMVELKDIDANTTVGKAVGELVKLGIINGYPDGTFRADNTISRGEIAKIIITFLGQESVAFDTIPSGFADVDEANHWAKKYIKLAADQKIINGYPDGTFQADAPVKYTEIVKMLVCMLGYGTIAENRMIEGAAWYTGYMAVATERGILKNTSVNNVEEPASRGIVAILTYNCLKVETAQTDASGNIIINNGSTALENFQGKEEITGIVTGTQQTGISKGSTGLSKRQITVDVKGKEVTYQVPADFDTMSILGRKIDAYAEEGDADGDKISQITTKKNESTVVKAEEIYSADSRGLEYETETSSRRQSISFDNLKVIYNGKYDGSFKAEEFENILSGSVEFICNDGDGDAEVAFVSSYETFVVSSTEKNANPPKVYGKYNLGTPLTIPYNDRNIHFSLTKSGSSANAETIVKSLSEWDVISVMRSKDGADGRAVWNGIVTSKKVSGKVQTSEGDTRKEIGGKFYDISASYAAYEGSKPKMAVQDYVTVYLDHEGKIAAAAANTTENAVTVAYVVTAALETKVDSKAQLKLYNFTGSKRQTSPYLASTVRIDGEPYQDHGAALTALKEAAALANAGKSDKGITVKDYCQLIRYTTNTSGEVETIDTVAVNTSPSEDDLSLDIAFPLESNTNAGGTLTYSGGRFLDQNGYVFMVNNSTTVLEIPHDNISNIDEYKMPSYSSAFTTNKKYRVEAFDLSASGAAKYVISYVGGTVGDETIGAETINEKSPMMIVTNISSIEGDDVPAIDKAIGYHFPSGTKITDDKPITSKTGGMLEDKYAFGDIFRYALSDNKIIETQQILAFGSGKPMIYNIRKDGAPDITVPVETAAEAAAQRSFKVDDAGNTDTQGRFMFGTLLDWDSSGLTFTFTTKEDTCGVVNTTAKETVTISSAKIIVYDYAANGENRIVVDSTLDTASAYDQLIKKGVSQETAEATASQILVYYTGNYSAKAIIVFKY